MKKIVATILFIPISLWAQEESKVAPYDRPDMTWFKEAKLGIFIHWGIYAVNGIAESWSFYRNEISHENYMKQLDGFTAENHDPDAWATLFKEAGANKNSLQSFFFIKPSYSNEQCY